MGGAVLSDNGSNELRSSGAIRIGSGSTGIGHDTDLGLNFYDDIGNYFQYDTDNYGFDLRGVAPLCLNSGQPTGGQPVYLSSAHVAFGTGAILYDDGSGGLYSNIGFEISSSGTITATAFVGDASGLTGITVATPRLSDVLATGSDTGGTPITLYGSTLIDLNGNFFPSGGGGSWSSDGDYGINGPGGFTIDHEGHVTCPWVNTPVLLLNPSSTVADLPNSGVAGQYVDCSDGCNPGEISGSGTGCLVRFNGTFWAVVGTGLRVTN